ncbi:MAG: LamG-like jellyroll fold domain-containing protein [Aestuariivirga sp.]
MKTGILVLEITGARAQATVRVDGVYYAAGAVVPLRFSDQEYATRLDDADPTLTYKPRLSRQLTIEWSAISSAEGKPTTVGGVAMPKLSRVVLRNEDGYLNWMRLVSLDGATAVVREIPFEADPGAAGRVRPVLQTDPSIVTWFTGATSGEPAVKLDKTVEIDVIDSFDDRLRKPAQVAKYLGLGGRIQFDGTGTGRASVPHSSALNVSVFTWIFLYSHDGSANAGSVIAKSDTDTTAASFNVRRVASPTGTLRFRVNVTSGSTNAVDVVIPTNTPRWVVFSWNGSTISVQQANQDGTGLTAATTAALSGTLRTTANPLEFGWSNVAGTADCELSELRLYNRVLSQAEIAAQLGRPLDVEASADVNGLVGYWPCNERAATWLTNVYPAGGALDAVLSGTYSWGSTLTGEPSQSGQYLPVVLGGLPAVELASIDEALDIWAVSATSAQNVFRVYNAELAGLTPTFAVTSGWILTTVSSTVATIERTGGGLITEWVPGMQVTLGTGWVGNNGKTLTITEVLGSYTRARVTGTGLANETAASGLVTALSPQWKLYLAGDNRYIQMLTATKTPPVAWVQGENVGGATTRLAGVIKWLLTESQVDIAFLSELTDSTQDRMNDLLTDYANEVIQFPAGLHIPAGAAVPVYDLLERILPPVGLHLIGTGGQLELGAIEMGVGAKSTISVLAEEVDSVEVKGLRDGPPPKRWRMIYKDPPYAPAPDSISPGAILAVAELVRNHGIVESRDNTAAQFATIWPTATETEPIWSPLGSKDGAAYALAHAESIAATRRWSLRILADTLAGLLPGTKLDLQAGPAGGQPEQLYGLEAGVDAIVGGVVLDIALRRYVAEVLVAQSALVEEP